MRVRKARVQDAAAIARVHVDTWRTTYQGIIADDFLATLSYARREDWWRDVLSSAELQQIVHVAESKDNGVIGFVSAGPEHADDPIYRGEISAIYVLENYQRLGVGKELFQASIRELSKRKISSLLIWVLEHNPARKFYEAMGGKFLRHKQIIIGGLRLSEVAYGWKNTHELL